jgi:hypothetical protein
MPDDEAIIEEAIGHLMDATSLIEQLDEHHLSSEVAQPVAQAAATLRAHSYTLKSRRGGQRWPPTPEVSG